MPMNGWEVEAVAEREADGRPGKRRGEAPRAGGRPQRALPPAAAVAGAAGHRGAGRLAELVRLHLLPGHDHPAGAAPAHRGAARGDRPSQRGADDVGADGGRDRPGALGAALQRPRGGAGRGHRGGETAGRAPGGRPRAGADRCRQPGARRDGDRVVPPGARRASRQARAILFSSEYERQKRIYAWGVTLVLDRVRSNLDRTLRAERRVALSWALVTVGVLLVLLAAWG